MTTLIASQLDPNLALSRIGFRTIAPHDTSEMTSATAFTRAAVNSASPENLVVMLYQRLGLDLTRAVTDMKAGNTVGATAQVTHATQIVDHLRNTLNDEVWSGASALMSLYQYLLESFSRAQVTQDHTVIEPCIAMVAELTEAWAAVAK